jgi:ATPase family associated with various cellular activities (AAA)
METQQLDRLKTLFKEDGDARNEAALLSRDLLYLVQSAITNAGSPKLAKAVAIGSAAYTVGNALHGFWKLYRRTSEPKTYTIKIAEDDAIFEIVEDWFMEALPEESQRSVFAHSSIIKQDTGRERGRSRFPVPATSDDEDDRVTIDYSFDGTIVQALEIAGHTVQVFTNIPETRGLMGEGAASKSLRSMNIVCPTVEARNAVLEEIEEQSQHLVQSQPRLYTSTRWGEFRRKAEIQPRKRESVVLKEGQMDRILGHLNTFLSNKEAYEHADLPFRTGILLYGDPGSGKSSTALAIANELRMNVYIINLSSLHSDETLGDCFSNVPPNSIIILEDIDIAHAVKDRDDDEQSGVTMSGMLNVLDGFQSPPGVITIMTTNRKDVLDPAIIRPGRVDLQEHLDCLDYFQLQGLCKYFTGTVPFELPHITPEHGITSADVMGVIRKHLPDFENAGEDIVKFVTEKKTKKPELTVVAA